LTGQYLIRYKRGGELRFKKLPARFYRAPGGREPVREFLKARPVADRRAVGRDIGRLEFAWPVGMPMCRVLGRGLYEIRANLEGGRIVRVIFCVSGGYIVLLHAFVKKTQRLRSVDLDLARTRMKELE
jgi:phage-related protein